MKKLLLGLAGTVALALGAGTASAAVVGSITQGSGTGANNGVFVVYGVNTVSGWFGADWVLVGGPANISVTFLGREAGDNNTFTFGGGGFANSSFSNNAFSSTGFATYIVNSVASGLLNFSFSNPNRGSVANGSNPDIPTTSVNFFSRIQDCSLVVSCSSGTILDLWFDDRGGAGTVSDDNHDDMVIRLAITGGSFQVVPIPAALPLLLSGLIGLGFVARRRVGAA